MKTLLSTLTAAGLLMGATACEPIFAPLPEADPEAVFEHLWTAFHEEYGGFEARRVDWEALYLQYRPGVTAATTDPELFRVLSDMLAHLDDAHVTLTAPGESVFLSHRIRRERVDHDLFDLAVVRGHYLEPSHRAGAHGSYVHGRIREQPVGYIHFRSVDADFRMLPRLLDEHPDVAGYVIDLRRNEGGNHTHAFAHLGRLTDRDRPVFLSRTKNGPGPGDYTPWHEWHLRAAGPYVDRPIVVLVDRYTPSAAERAVMALRTLPNVTLIGDTTSGAISTKIPRELANGWFYTLSPQQVVTFDGISYEGRGIDPDIFVKNEVDELRAGVDRVLQTAIDLLR